MFDYATRAEMPPAAQKKALSWIAALAIAAAAPDALAQTVDLGQIQDVARGKAEEGLALFAEGKWADAYERFRIAEDLFHAPTLVLHMAHCKLELGELLAARELYRRLADETLPADAPPAFTAAVATAKERLELLATRIPTVAIAVRGTAPQGLHLRIDGEDAPVAPSRVELDPGTHRLEATSPSTQPYERTFELAAGARETLDVELLPLPTKTRVVAAPRGKGSIVPALIAYGVGAAGLGVGAVTGVMVLREVSRLKDECGGTTCPSDLEKDRDDARPLALVSTIGFVAGGVGVAAGTVLLFWRPLGAPAPTRSALTVTATPSRIGVTGTF